MLTAVLGAALLWRPAAHGVKPAKAKTTCNAKELKGFDCRLMQGEYNLRLLDSTIAWKNSSHHTVDPMPLVGEGVEWEKIRFEIMGHRPVLQMWLWDKPVGQVQSLRWYVADTQNRKMAVLAQGVVRKRSLKEDLPAGEGEAAPVAGGKPKPPAKPKYIYDAFEPHSVRLLKDDRLEWTLGRDKKILEKAGAAHGI
ncbi:MAG: hypothetical protein KF799_05135 [Bdellovibrionales bacterium]|nr:hypothetical protein [Bdellovibrionales bacterium]